MARGRIGRVPALVALLKRTKRPMHIREIAALLRDNGDENVTSEQIGATLAVVVRRKPDLGVQRRKTGYYVYNPQADVPVTATRNRSDDLGLPKRRVRAIREEQVRNAAEDSAIVETERNIAADAAHDAYAATLEKLRDGLVNPREQLGGVVTHRLSDHAADCALITTHSLTCTCGTFTRLANEASAKSGPLQPKVSMDASWASAHPFPFTHIRIVRTLSDGRVLFTDDPSGRAWVAKEI